MQYELGFIGAGNMAEAIAKAAIDKHILKPQQIIAADPNPQRRDAFKKLDITTTDDNALAIKNTKQLLLAVKPQVMAQAAADLGKHGSPQQVFISIMAGINTPKLAAAIAHQGHITNPRVVRVMPNTPLQVGLGMAGVALGQHTTKTDAELAMRLFSAAGKVILVDESQLDAVTALSGSGPAYIFYLAQAMQRAADELGLTEHAATLTQQTILGAAHLLTASNESPNDLRRKVTSPGGTTEAAINYLDSKNTADAIVNAIKAAYQRSIELGK